MDLSGKLSNLNSQAGKILFNFRNANSIKNHFYTVIRILLKLLFKWHA